MRTHPDDFAHCHPDQLDSQPDLTKREWFTGLAMQGCVANNDTLVSATESAHNHGMDMETVVAIRLLRFADALIAALNKEAKDE